MNALPLILTVFVACAVEAIEALTIVLAAGITREWKSTFQGMAVALVVLAVITAVVGPAITYLPLTALRLVIGALLAIFGLQWLRKAILRATGYKGLHDEASAYLREVTAAETAARESKRGVSDWYAFTLAFKGVLLEGLEVVFIVITFGANQHNVGAAVIGAAAAVLVVAVAGIAVRAWNRSRDKAEPLVLKPWSMPESLLPVAIQAKSKADEDKMSQALARLVAEDPTLRLENNAETRQLVLWCMGEAHADLALDRLSTRYGVAVETVGLRVPLRETVAGKAQGLGRNVKQSGGHGEFGICSVEVEPLPSGSGLEFVDKIVGGVVPRQFIPSVEKGVRAQMEQGVLAGYPMVDIRVTLKDGKAHSVDSSDMAFQKAGRAALRDAAAKAQVQLLEPVDEVSVLVADDYVGAIMSDLSSRRGRVLGTEPVAGGRTLVKAEIPELEVIRYAIDLRSMSHGTGSFTRNYLRYEPLPSHLAEKVAAADKA